MNITPWPMKTSSSTSTPSQMNVWLLDLAIGTDRDAALDLDERPDTSIRADPTSVDVREGLYDDIRLELDVLDDAKLPMTQPSCVASLTSETLVDEFRELRGCRPEFGLVPRRDDNAQRPTFVLSCNQVSLRGRSDDVDAVRSLRIAAAPLERVTRRAP